jgi:hypothetical protein
MYQRDYILRMIDMLGDLIMGLLGKIRKGELQQAHEDIEKLYADFLKEDSALFASIPAEQLTERLLKEHNYTNGHLEMLAMLFDAEAELALAEGRLMDSIDSSEKAVILYSFIAKETKTLSFQNEDKIAGIQNRISQLKKRISYS